MKQEPADIEIKEEISQNREIALDFIGKSFSSFYLDGIIVNGK